MEQRDNVSIKHPSEQHAQSTVPKYQWVSNENNHEKA